MAAAFPVNDPRSNQTPLEDTNPPPHHLFDSPKSEHSNPDLPSTAGLPQPQPPSTSTGLRSRQQQRQVTLDTLDSQGHPIMSNDFQSPYNNNNNNNNTTSTMTNPPPRVAPTSQGPPISLTNNPPDELPKRQLTADSRLTRRTTPGTTNGGPGGGAGGAAGGVGATTTLRKMTTGLFTPSKPVNKREAPTVWRSLWNLGKSNWVNVLLPCVFISWGLHFAPGVSDTIRFVIAFLGIIPLAGLLGYATENLTLYVSEVLAGLLNATLGNAVELIVSIIALLKCELTVVQSSLIGSILGNLLLVMGTCFIVGGTRFKEQTFKATASQLNSSLLLIAVIAVLIPSVFRFSVTITASGEGDALTSQQEADALLHMSHGVAIILLVIYLGYLLFQFWSHADLYEDEEGPKDTVQYPPSIRNAPHLMVSKMNLARKYREKHHNSDGDSNTSTSGSPTVANGDVRSAIAHIHGTSSALERPVNGLAPDVAALEMGPEEEEEPEEEVPEMNWASCIISMVVSAVLVGVTSEFLVDSINGLVAANPSLSAQWVGLILVAIVGNVAEHWTAITASYRDQLDLSLSVAVGSSIQIALFVIPLVEIIAWIAGKPLLLLFDPFLSVILFLGVLAVNQTIGDGRSNWMEGLILLMIYIIIAVAAWYYPGSTTSILAAGSNTTCS